MTVLDTLIATLRDTIDAHTQRLRDGELSADAWERACARDLLEHHVAAYLADKPGDRTLRSADKRILANVVGDQLDYLNPFADVLDGVGSDEWSTTYESRARMYAGSIRQSHARGQTFGLPLPYYPADGRMEPIGSGTNCLSNCACVWEIEIVDEEAGDANATWQVAATDHCDVCLARADKNPYQIRGGQLL